MKRRTKACILALCAVALVSVSVLGTLAWLTSTSKQVVNTFTVGNVTITLDEADVKPDGTLDTNERVQGNEYKLIPGHTYQKDPTVHVAADSENCWLFVKVQNGIAAIEDSNDTIAAQMADLGWTLVDGETNIYAYKTIVPAETDVPVFNHFTIAGNGDVSTVTSDTNITVMAYAIQAEGFETSAAAWEAYTEQTAGA